MDEIDPPSWITILRQQGRVDRYFTSRIPYTLNSISTFNVTRLRRANSGDINPNPGPSITSFTTNRFRQRRVMQRRRNPCNLVQIKCDSDLHLRTSTTNLTMSGLEVKSGITGRVWPINTVESRRTFPSKVKNLHNAINKNNLVQICITLNRKPVISNKSTLSAPKFCLFVDQSAISISLSRTMLWTRILIFLLLPRPGSALGIMII